MITEKDYCDKDLSLALKEAGYIGQGRCYYDLDKEPNKLRHFGIQVLTTRSAEALNFVLAVHLYEAQKWLREEKEIEIVVHSFDYVGEPYFADIYMYREVRLACNYANSYEEALSEGIKKASQILKEHDKSKD